MESLPRKAFHSLKKRRLIRRSHWMDKNTYTPIGPKVLTLALKFGMQVMKAPEIDSTASSQPRAVGPDASPDRPTKTRKRLPSSTPADGAKQTSAIFGEAATQTENTQRRGSSRPHQEDRPTSRVPTILKAAAVLGGAYYIANTRHRVEQKPHCLTGPCRKFAPP